MKHVSLFLTFWTILLSVPVFGQNEGNVWYFGGLYHDQSEPGAGLDFGGGSPEPLFNSGMGYTEGCASYCNTFGEILFYAEGDSVYDRTHSLMMNGDQVGGYWSSSQAALVVPITGDTNRFYLFSNDGFPTGNGSGLHYSKIDLTLNNGYGAVTTKANLLLDSTGEQMTGTYHANGTDFWVIATSRFPGELHAFQVSPSEISMPVTSQPIIADTHVGSANFSPSGSLLSILTQPDFGSAWLTMIVEFDNTTGVFSNPILFDDSTSIPMATCFSPNGDLLYEFRNFDWVTDTLFQYDLNSANIEQSKTAVAAFDANSIDLRIGPDEKIYIANWSPYIDAINFPNVLGVDCEYEEDVINLGDRHSGAKFPNVHLIAEHVLGVEHSMEKGFFKPFLYPNPMISSSDLVFHNPKNERYKFQLYSASGELVLQLDAVFGNRLQIQKGNLSSGLYLYKIANESGFMATGKFLIADAS